MDNKSPTVGQVFAFALVVGLIIGVVEAGYIIGHWYIDPRVQLQNWDVVWMAPLADACAVGLVGLLLGLLTRVLPSRLLGRTTIMAALLATGVHLFLLTFEKIHWSAMLLVAVGLGVQSARRLAPRAITLWSSSWRRVAWLAAGVALLGVAVHLYEGWRERRDLAGLPAAGAGAPNIILLVLDTVRRDHLGLYGYPRATSPVMDSLGGGGMVFDHAYSSAPWTLLSHATMFTGRLPHEVSATWRVPLDHEFPTLAEGLGRRGYQSGGFTGNVTYVSRETGLARGFIRFRDFRISFGKLLLTPASGRRWFLDWADRWRLVRNSAATVNEWCLDWLDSRDRRRPFFAFLNYADAHDPYEPPTPFDRRFGDSTAAGDEMRRRVRRVSPKYWRPGDMATGITQYDGAIAYMDDQLGALFSGLQKRGLLENTVVIVTADHGEMLGEHELMLHGNSLYRPLLEVPLIIAGPGAGIGRQLRPVSLVDLAATVIALSGSPKVEPILPGSNLLTPDAGGRTKLFSELDFMPSLVHRQGPVAKGPMWAILADDHRLIRSGDASEEMYDFASDSLEVRDQAADVTAAPIRQRLGASLDTISQPGRIRNRGMLPIKGPTP